MKRLSLFLLLGLATLHAQENGIDQPFNFITPPEGGKFIQWHGNTGRTYFTQVSDPSNHLGKWNWAPSIEAGNDEDISYEVDGTADKGFFRLQYTNQPIPSGETPDTADFDGDGISNIGEITPIVTGGHTTQTNPLDGDTDHDGLPDKWERDHGLDPTDDGSIDPNNGPGGDPDGDRFANAAEYTGKSSPQDVDDFPTSTVQINKSAYGNSTKLPAGNPQDYTGSCHWGGEWAGANHLDELISDSAVTPAYLHNKLNSVAFPATPPDNEGTISAIESGAALTTMSRVTLSADGDNVSSRAAYGRVWIKAPQSDLERTFRYLRVLSKSTHVNSSNTDETVVMSVTPVNFVIPANGTISSPVDLEPLPQAAADCVVIYHESLVRVGIEQQNYDPFKGIRFCRWLDAFPNGIFDTQCADTDRDRFRIVIPTIVPNLTKMSIKATNLHGAMIDGAPVEKTSDGDYEVDMIQENGAMVSKPILLVSDGDDDKKYNGVGMDDGKNDQTLLADFDSGIIVTFPELGNAQAEFKARKAVGKVTMNIRYMSPSGQLPPDKLAAILLHVAKMREIYRQIGIKVDVAEVQGEQIPQQWLDARPAPSEEAINYLGSAECGSIRSQIRNRQVPIKHLRIGYVDAKLNPDGLIFTAARGFTVQGQDGVVVSLLGDNGPFYGTTAHEVAHTLNLGHVTTGHYLMYEGVSLWKNDEKDIKRFLVGDFDIMKSSNDFYVPIQ